MHDRHNHLRVAMIRDDLRVRAYAPDDRSRCLAIFDGNVPSSFTPAERPAFERFLDELPGPYLLIEDASGDLIACGGYAVVSTAPRADLCWGMVARDRQGSGYGRLLTELRIEGIRGFSDVSEVIMNTSQHTRAFYERLGFVTVSVTPDGFGPGLDRCDMRLDLPARVIAVEDVR